MLEIVSLWTANITLWLCFKLWDEWSQTKEKSIDKETSCVSAYGDKGNIWYRIHKNGGQVVIFDKLETNISYMVNVVSRFMSDPQEAHLDIVKHLFKYLKEFCKPLDLMQQRRRQCGWKLFRFKLIEGFKNSDINQWLCVYCPKLMDMDV